MSSSGLSSALEQSKQVGTVLPVYSMDCLVPSPWCFWEMAEPLGGGESSRAQLGYWVVPLKGIPGPGYFVLLDFPVLCYHDVLSSQKPKATGPSKPRTEPLKL